MHSYTSKENEYRANVKSYDFDLLSDISNSLFRMVKSLKSKCSNHTYYSFSMKVFLKSKYNYSDINNDIIIC